MMAAGLVFIRKRTQKGRLKTDRAGSLNHFQTTLLIECLPMALQSLLSLILEG